MGAGAHGADGGHPSAARFSSGAGDGRLRPEDIQHMIEPSVRAQGVLAWPLGDGRRIAEPNAFLQALAPQLFGAGVPRSPT